MSDGVVIEESEFKKLSVKNQNLVIYKVVSNIKEDNLKLNMRQKLLALSQAGLYVLISWIIFKSY